MIERAEAAAAAITPAELGLDGAVELFARTLGEAVGASDFAGDELDDWARGHGGTAGVRELRRLQALGVIEIVPGATAARRWAFNPAALRVLA